MLGSRIVPVAGMVVALAAPALAQTAPRDDIAVDELIKVLTPEPVSPIGNKLSAKPKIKLRGSGSLRIRGATVEANNPPPKPPSIDLTVNFEYDSARLAGQAYSLLAKVGKALRSDQLQGLKFDIVGHTDAAGSDNYNLTLSQQRALAVANYLIVDEGIDPARLYTHGLGEGRLLYPKAPDDGRNRRVEFRTRIE